MRTRSFDLKHVWHIAETEMQRCNSSFIHLNTRNYCWNQKSQVYDLILEEQLATSRLEHLMLFATQLIVLSPVSPDELSIENGK